MVSSLATQLAKGTSLNASLLVDRTRRKAAASYLFSAKEAQQHDLDTVYALGVSGFLQLKALEPSLGVFEKTLFSDAAKARDRTLESVDVNKELDQELASFLPLLGPYLLDSPTGKVLEWLVRRFRVNEFNVLEMLALFLPYHESPHFVKMMTILHMADQSPFRFLIACKTTATPLPRSTLITEMLKNSDLSRFVANLLPSTLKTGGLGAHKTLVMFHTSVLLDFIARNSDPDEGTMGYLLPAALEPTQLGSETAAKHFVDAEGIEKLGSLLILAALSQKCRLTSKTMKAVLVAIASCTTRCSAKQFVRTLLCICAPQDEMDKFPRSLVKAFLTIPEIDVELEESLDWVGSDKLLNPLMAGLMIQFAKERSVRLFASILAFKNISTSTIRRSVSLLLDKLIEKDDESTPVILEAKKLLSTLQQRHSQTIQSVCSEAINQDESKRDAIEQLVLSISIPLSGSSGSGDAQKPDLVVASVSADAQVRAIATRDLLNALSNPDTPSTELDTIKTSLRLRVQDTDPTVIEALYAKPADIVPVLMTDAAAYILSVSEAIRNPGSSHRSVVLLHLSFMAKHVFSYLRGTQSSLADCVVHDLFFPNILYSKPKQTTASELWGIIEEAENDRENLMGIGQHVLLGGCVDAIRWEEGRNDRGARGDDGHRNVQLLSRINLAIAAKMADNILSSDDYSNLLAFLLKRLQDPNPHSRALAYLIARALLSRLSGEHQLNAAHQMLQAMQLDSLEVMGDFMGDVNDIHAFLHDTSLGTAVVLKPSSRNTTHRLQIALLAMLPKIHRPSGVKLNWLMPSVSLGSQGCDTRGTLYVQLMRAVYSLSNSSPRLPLLSTNLLRILFTNLADEALTFLAGVWLSPPGVTEVHKEMRDHVILSALGHAKAFLEAHIAAEHWLDFQTILPAVLVIVQHANLRVREAALRVIAIITHLSLSKNIFAVYAFDTIYGDDSGALQYADLTDLRRYFHSLGETHDHLVQDANYLKVFHQQNLTAIKSDNKKNAGYKRRILCYLLSHVNACNLPIAKQLLLKSLETTTSEVKCEMLLPTIESMFDKTLMVTELETAVSQALELATLIVSSFDASAVANLNDISRNTWSIYERTLRVCFSSKNMDSLRSILRDNLQRGLFSKLSADRKIDLCRLLLDISIQDVTATTECKQLLSEVLVDVTIMIRLLTLFQPTSDGSTEPAQKRARLESTEEDGSQSTTPYLSLLAEVLAARPLPSSLELIACLLETLNKAAHDASVQPADRNYIEQLLMSAVDNAVGSIRADSDVPPNAVRVDVLVELIRTSENPQTFHQALLLMAGLARLAPDAVLHNIMPIFTFMGSNVFHRDDAYSFRVVQKTIESTVPVMTASLKSMYTTKLDLYIGSREFLRIFTDASNHIPRHRRAKFFSHLVDVLGPSDFFAPICMLLIDRVSNRVVRQNAQDAHASLILPLTAFQHYSIQDHFVLLIEVLHEVQRLSNQTSSSNPDTTFLATATDDDQSHQASPLWRRRALALLLFCHHHLKELPAKSSAKELQGQSLTSELLSHLLKIAVTNAQDESRNEISVAARNVMNSALQIMPASDFISGVLTMISTENAKIQSGALELLGERLTAVSDPIRRESTSVMIQIVERTRQIITSTAEESVLSTTFQALRAISTTMCPGEEGILMTIVPLVLENMQARRNMSVTLSLLLSFCSSFGPRIIPHIKTIVWQCVAFIRECMRVDGADNSPAIALNALQSLLTSVPTFWGEKDLVQVIDLYIEFRTASSKAESTFLEPVVKTMANRVPSTVLLPALGGIWTSLNASGLVNDQYKRLGYFNLLKRAIRASNRPIILENLRHVFKIFQDAFEINAASGNADTEPELISSFLELVVKLNENAFKPLLRKLSDWAFSDENSDIATARAAVFCRTYAALLDYFKALMVPYMMFLWPPLLKVLDDYCTGNRQGQPLWVSVLEVLAKTLAHDEGAFWRHDKLQQLVNSIVKQLPVCIESQQVDGRSTLADCLVATMEVIHDDALLKTMNIDILMHTRSENAKLRLYSLTCSKALWKAHGGKLLGFASETTPFIAECAEDENDSVVREAHGLKDAVEMVVGKLNV
ncbi:uncharacterized protein FIBRA_02746 [Fibroporia radiculosa]|uniref:U3 small nucleolar RNA-associated protein 10 n=1 Tax=Fibroporia radiculosa TaxID=599839 RepID=J4I982_9APHY|nr:uncharacterized protein FIBRA_02746 [Fibroporia radiculosa]CCM00706.1 predicted protein [Fibroporia radiculosa]